LAIEGIGFHEKLQQWPRVLRHLYVLVLVTIGWMILRADTPAAALAFLSAMIGLTAAMGPTIEPHLTPLVWLALALAFIGAGPLVPAISRWRVSIDAGTTSLLMMLAATGVFIWRPAAVVIQTIRNYELGIKNS
jgi:hypothetical protein